MVAPSAWVQRWSHLMAADARVLDVACGKGRHVRWFAGRGARVTGVDRNAATVEALGDIAEIVVADIEQGPWPLAGRRFDAVIVTNYLWRPLAGTLVDSVAEGGCLIWETFADGNQTVGRPANPDFLLTRGELLALVHPLRIVAFEDGVVEDPTRFVQRVVAVRERADATTPARYRL